MTSRLSSQPQWARVVSSVFHPFVMPVFTLVALFLTDPILRLYGMAFTYLLVVLTVNTLAPALSLWLMHRRGLIGDLEIRDRRQRPLPFLVVLVYYVLTYFVVSSGDNASVVPHVYLSLLMGLIAAIFGATLITRWFKISMHGMGVGGTLGAVVAVQALHFSPDWTLNAVLILIGGLVGWSRLAMQVHTHREVYAGWLYGFLVMFVVVFLGGFH